MTQSMFAAVLPDRSVLAMTGTDRLKFLQALVTNDVRLLGPDRPLYAGVLSGQGKLVCDVFLVLDGERILIDMAAAGVEVFLQRLTRFKLGSQVAFGEAEPKHAVAALWGPGAGDRLGLVQETGKDGWAGHVFIDPRLAQLGARIVYPAAVSIDDDHLARLGFATASAADYAAHRLALGVADTVEIGGETCYPLEANFEGLHGVDFKKGCYVGQELTARMHLKGALRRRILPVTGDGPLPELGTQLMADGVELGPLIAVSGTAGLAMLRLDRLAGARDGEIRARETPLSVNWPDWLPH